MDAELRKDFLRASDYPEALLNLPSDPGEMHALLVSGTLDAYFRDNECPCLVQTDATGAVCINEPCEEHS